MLKANYFMDQLYNWYYLDKSRKRDLDNSPSEAHHQRDGIRHYQERFEGEIDADNPIHKPAHMSYALKHPGNKPSW